MKRTAAAAALALALTAAVLAATPAPAGADDTPPHWLALGDSYSSGEGLSGTDPPGKGNPECARANGRTGAEAWAVVAYDEVWGRATLHDNQVFTACTGAVSSSDDPSNNDAEAQIDEAQQWLDGATANVVSFSFGGNDIGFGGVLKDCIDAPGGETSWVKFGNGCDIDETEMRSRIDMLVGNKKISGAYYGSEALPALYDLVAENTAPGGHVFVLGYPQIVEDLGRWPSINRYYWSSCQRIRNSDVAMLRSATGYLNEQIGRAVMAADERHSDVHFHFLDVSKVYESDSGRHALCSADPWLNGVTVSGTSGDVRLMRSFHPTQAGYNATGQALAAEIREIGTAELSPRAPTPDPPSIEPIEWGPEYLTAVMHEADSSTAALHVDEPGGGADTHLWSFYDDAGNLAGRGLFLYTFDPVIPLAGTDIISGYTLAWWERTDAAVCARTADEADLGHTEVRFIITC